MFGLCSQPGTPNFDHYNGVTQTGFPRCSERYARRTASGSVANTYFTGSALAVALLIPHRISASGGAASNLFTCAQTSSCWL
jgi:hypothetical protein